LLAIQLQFFYFVDIYKRGAFDLRVDALLDLAMYFFHRKPAIAVKMSLRMGFS